MIPTIAPGVIAGFPVSSGETPYITNFVLTIGVGGAGGYGFNQQITDAIWHTEFGSLSPDVIPMGGEDSSYEFTVLATNEDNNGFYVVFQGAHTQDFFEGITPTHLISGNFYTASAAGYFITEISGMYQTFWSWAISDVGDWDTFGVRNIGIGFNPIYQQPATTRTFLFGPNSLYAWTGWPGDDMSTQGQFAQGGKMNVSAAFASPLYPEDGSFGDPAIYGKHNGISIGLITGSGAGILLLLQNSDGTENYQLSGPCFATPLNTVDATYHDLHPDMVAWGCKAFYWNTAVLGWGGDPYNEFTLTNLD